MNELKKRMISQAKQEYQQIFPCRTKQALSDCFTVEENKILFWFNTKDQTTHLLMHEIA